MRVSRSRQAGFTLIELMVALLISMVLSIAVMLVMSSFESRRRTSGSTSDLEQAGAIAMFQVDRWVRSAGSGLAQGDSYAYGCRLFAQNGSTQLLPRSSALPAPFASVSPNVSGEFRLAPVVIMSGQTTPGASGKASDALVLMQSGNETSQAPIPMTVSQPPTASKLTVANTADFSASDLLLLADQQHASGGGPADCIVSQVANTLTANATAIPLGGTSAPYYAATIGSVSIASFTDASLAFNLGGASTTSSSLPPSFQVIGVGDNNTLYSYDLLNVSGTTVQPQADGVFEMHAVYGINSTGNANNVIDNWVTAASGNYSAANLTDGSATAAARLKNIRAVRVALIMRTALPEKDPVTTATSLPMFTDLTTYGLNTSRALTTAEQHYRYRVVESTIPVRNNNY